MGYLQNMVKHFDSANRIVAKEIRKIQTQQKEDLKDDLLNTRLENVEIVTGLSNKLQPKNSSALPIEIQQLPEVTIGNDKNLWIKRNWWKLLIVICTPLLLILVLPKKSKSKSKNLV